MPIPAQPPEFLPKIITVWRDAYRLAALRAVVAWNMAERPEIRDLT